MNCRIKNLFGNKVLRNERIIVAEENPSIQSMGSLINLKIFYQQIDDTYKQNELHFKVWLRFRNKWLKKQKKLNKGILTCFFCSASNLNSNFNSPYAISSKQKATIDHLVPVSKGGKKFDEKNLVVACSCCNGKKSDIMPAEFIKKSA